MDRVRFALVLVVMLVLYSCAESDALNVFNSKGLVVLQPARTIVTAGGLFSVASSGGGKPGYIDSDNTDPILKDSSSFEANCTEVFGDEQRQQSMTFNAAVSALAKIIPFAAGLQADSAVTIHLTGFSSPCQRLNARVLPTLVNEQLNKPVILSELHKPTHNHVYVVLEVDSTKSLMLTADSNAAFTASYQGQGKLPQCSTGGPSGGSGESGPSGASGSKSTSGPSGAAGKAKGGGPTGGSSPSGPSGSSGAGGSGISVGACMATVYQLSLTSDPAVPFAVRLSEVYENPPNSGILDIKYTGFKFPARTLGAGSPLERATAKLSSNMLNAGFEHQARSAR